MISSVRHRGAAVPPFSDLHSQRQKRQLAVTVDAPTQDCLFGGFLKGVGSPLDCSKLTPPAAAGISGEQRLVAEAGLQPTPRPGRAANGSDFATSDFVTKVSQVLLRIIIIPFDDMSVPQRIMFSVCRIRFPGYADKISVPAQTIPDGARTGNPAHPNDAPYGSIETQ